MKKGIFINRSWRISPDCLRSFIWVLSLREVDGRTLEPNKIEVLDQIGASCSQDHYSDVYKAYEKVVKLQYIYGESVR